MGYTHIVYKDGPEGRASAAVAMLHFEKIKEGAIFYPSLFGMPFPKEDDVFKNCRNVIFLDMVPSEPTKAFLDKVKIPYTVITRLRSDERAYGAMPSAHISEHYSTPMLTRYALSRLKGAGEALLELNDNFMNEQSNRALIIAAEAMDESPIKGYYCILENIPGYLAMLSQGRGIINQRNLNIANWLKSQQQEPSKKTLSDGRTLSFGVFQHQLFDMQYYAKAYIEKYSADACISWTIAPKVVVFQIHAKEGMDALEIAKCFSLSPGGGYAEAGFSLPLTVGLEFVGNLLKKTGV